MKTLLTYYRRHHLRTVRQILTRWAPPKGQHRDGTPYTQDTAAYVAHVADRLGVDPHEPLAVEDPAVLVPLAQAIVRHECGRPPGGAADWYPPELYAEAARLALGRPA